MTMGTRRSGRVVTGVLLAGALVATPSLGAQPRGGAGQTATSEDQLFAEYRRLRAAGLNEQALEEARGVYERTRNPAALVQMGSVELALATAAPWRMVDAEAHLEEALRTTGNAWIDTRRGAIGADLAALQGRLGTVRVRGNVEAMQLVVGLAAPRLIGSDATVRVPAGEVDLELRAPGHQSQRMRRTVPAGRTPLAIEVTLARETAAVVAAPATVVPTATATVTVTPVVAPSAPVVRVETVVGTPPRARARWMRPLAIGLAAGAGAMLAAGVVATLVGSSAADRWNSDQCLQPGTTREQQCGGDRDTADTMRAVAIAGYAAGGLLAVGAVVLLVAAPSSRESPAGVGLRGCGVSVGGRGAGCVFVF